MPEPTVEKIGGISFAMNAQFRMLDEITAVLKEIGCEDKHYKKVAEILVGLEMPDADLLPAYMEFVSGLEPHNKEKIYKAILEK